MPQDKPLDMPSELDNRPSIFPPAFKGAENSEPENPFDVQEDTGERATVRHMTDVRLRVLSLSERRRNIVTSKMAVQELAECDGRIIPRGILEKKFAILREPESAIDAPLKATVAPPRRKAKPESADIPDEIA